MMRNKIFKGTLTLFTVILAGAGISYQCQYLNASNNEDFLFGAFGMASLIGMTLYLISSIWSVE